VNSDLVIQYLNENPEFLENYVLNHVNQERLQRWTAWKEQVRRQRHGDGINGKAWFIFVKQPILLMINHPRISSWNQPVLSSKV